MFITQRRGVLILIPKSGNQKELKNKRPICLLDIIYKIIAKVLATRLSVVADKLIHGDQTGFIKGRHIQDNLRIIQDVINYSHTDGVGGILVALDFKSAFNSIEHNFIWYALRCFGFGDSFIRWAKLLYNGSMLAVLNNGYTSEWFEPKRGIMQGCPISGMLFNLAVELLAIKIRQMPSIRGVKINDIELKISQYADDTTVFVNDEDSAEELVKQLKLFGEVSGLELNVNKSKIMWIGTDRHKRGSVCNIPAVNKVKTLGMWFSSTECCNEQNLNPVIDQIKHTINRWSQRDVSLKGRITVSKSLLVSKLSYVMSCSMIPEAKLKSIQSLIMNYLWRGRPPKVKAKVLCQSIAEGGLGAVDTLAMYASLKLSWIRRSLNSKAAWARIFQARCCPYLLEDLLKSRFRKEDFTKMHLSEFYTSMLLEYRKLKPSGPCSPDEIMKELLWFNEEITIDKKSVFEKNMYSCGIKYVGDLVDANGRILTHDRFTKKFPACKPKFLKYCGIISSIPRAWKETIIEARSGMRLEDRDTVPTITFGDKEIPITKIKTKQLYSLRNKTSIIPTAFTRWQNEGLGQPSWSVVMNIPYQCTKSTKLQTFQYQILHRFIATNKFLYVRGIVESASCRYCQCIDTIIHYFFACQKVREFWNKVFQFINRNTFPERHIVNVSNIIFGIIDAPPVVNLIILLGKHYLYICKRNERMLSIDSFLEYVRKVRCTEMTAANDCSKKMMKTKCKWSVFVRELCDKCV